MNQSFNEKKNKDDSELTDDEIYLKSKEFAARERARVAREGTAIPKAVLIRKRLTRAALLIGVATVIGVGLTHPVYAAEGWSKSESSWSAPVDKEFKKSIFADGDTETVTIAPPAGEVKSTKYKIYDPKTGQVFGEGEVAGGQQDVVTFKTLETVKDSSGRIIGIGDMLYSGCYQVEYDPTYISGEEESADSSLREGISSGSGDQGTGSESNERASQTRPAAKSAKLIIEGPFEAAEAIPGQLLTVTIRGKKQTCPRDWSLIEAGMTLVINNQSYTVPAEGLKLNFGKQAQRVKAVSAEKKAAQVSFKEPAAVKIAPTPLGQSGSDFRPSREAEKHGPKEIAGPVGLFDQIRFKLAAALDKISLWLKEKK